MFVVSWVNPDTRLAEKSFADYLTEGVLGAVDAVTRATGVQEMNAIGYCIGGTLLAAALGYMAAKGDERIKSATFFATQVDFSEPGDLQVFIDEQQLANLDKMMEDKGYLEGQAMFTTFNMLRANDLFWSFYVNNYLLGKDPAPFDLLYWNADATRMPRKTHMFYLREMYLKNNLVKPGAIELAGVPIDLTQGDACRFTCWPPAKTTSRRIHPCSRPATTTPGPCASCWPGPATSRASSIPPGQAKYQYWVNPRQDGHVGELADWLGGAEEHPGSWWPDWDAWLAPQSGPKVAGARAGRGRPRRDRGCTGLLRQRCGDLGAVQWRTFVVGGGVRALIRILQWTALTASSSAPAS